VLQGLREAGEDPLAVGTAVFEGDEWVDEYLTNATKKLEETK